MGIVQIWPTGYLIKFTTRFDLSFSFIISLSFTLAGVDVTKRVDDSIHGIFMDPTARHMIVSMKSQESFYLARDSKKPKPLAKMKVSVVCN